MTRFNFNWCPDLIVRTDQAHEINADFKSISTMECKAKNEGRICKFKGVCVELRDGNTGVRVSKKSFSV